jgi:hypothetical protein
VPVRGRVVYSSSKPVVQAVCSDTARSVVKWWGIFLAFCALLLKANTDMSEVVLLVNTVCLALDV